MKIIHVMECFAGGTFNFLVDLTNELSNEEHIVIYGTNRENTPKNFRDLFNDIREAKKAIRKAFENQKEKRGFSIVEVLSTCPTNWGLSPIEALDRLREEMIPYYPLGVYKDITAKEGE